jgi:hypothetical protein
MFSATLFTTRRSKTVCSGRRGAEKQSGRRAMTVRFPLIDKSRRIERHGWIRSV